MSTDEKQLGLWPEPTIDESEFNNVNDNSTQATTVYVSDESELI